MERLIRWIPSYRILILLLGLSLTATLYSCWQYQSKITTNERVDYPLAPKAQDDFAPEVLFAKAYQLERTDPNAAIQYYGASLHKASHALQSRIHHNLGTLYLTEAAKLWKASGLSEYIRINTLLSVAKDHLRLALIANPDSWPTKFNLEYAERITPPPHEKPKNDFQGNKGSVFATLPSIPGGGP